ncbi:MAG: hypothetical protein ABI981_11580 [Betaproteobacteria bacterium]
MDFNQLLLNTNETVAMLVIVGVITAAVMGAWALFRSKSVEKEFVDSSVPTRDMRQLTDVPLEA